MILPDHRLFRTRGRFLGWVCLWWVGASALHGAAPAAKVDFNREIRPILSEHCYACHGPDERTRKAGLRLDLQEDAFKTLKSGERALIPGDVDHSTLVRRITTKDPDDVMPPKKGAKPLSDQQIATLRRWVQEGAEWKAHWAYIKPQRAPVPEVRAKAWARNEIDGFIAQKLEAKGLTPSPEADKARLLRRVSLDLTGLPPTAEELDAFLGDKDSKAYDKVVDRLLGSKHYGERMAQHWLDLARYGETQGYHHDAHRDMFHWRDWLIQAFNRNQRFDQFTIEQLAGDLLPNPTREQLIATGFQRNEMTTSEGGAIPEEYAVKYVVGRVDTASRVWLGTSMACAECHDHKYDPISQKDYYRFFAYFNTIAEHGMDQSANPVPRVPLSTPDQDRRLERYAEEVGALEKALSGMLDPADAKHDTEQAAWETRLRTAGVTSWKSATPASMKSAGGAELKAVDGDTVAVSGKNPDRDTYEIAFRAGSGATGFRLETLPSSELPNQGAGRDAKGEFVLTRVEVEARSREPERERARVKTLATGRWSVVAGVSAASAQEGFDKDFGAESQLDLSKPVGGQGWQAGPDAELDAAWKVSGEGVRVVYAHRVLQAGERFSVKGVLDWEGPVKVWLNGKVAFQRNAVRPAGQGADTVTLALSKGSNQLLVKAVAASGAGAGRFALSDGVVLQRAVTIAGVGADFSQPGFGIGGVLDQKIETGWAVGGEEASLRKPHQAWFRFDEPLGFAGEVELQVRLMFQSPQPGKNLGRFRLATTEASGLEEFLAQAEGIRNALLADATSRSAGQKDELRRRYRKEFVPDAKRLSELLDAKRSERDAFQNGIPVAMTMKEVEKPRDTFLLIRGEYNNRGEKVAPGVPARILPMPADYPANRLGLARWLTHPDHPLTSRVIMNQQWQRFFGTGIVKSSEDFGSQGEWPSHPELLDWLATEFIRSGWDLKAMQRLIVTSATYRQSGVVSARSLELDPEDRLLGRFPRQRLDAEAIRDTALAVSGLLNASVGGPSVFPYQPPGLWEQVAFEGTRSWVQSEGTDNYRRGLYTYWRRSVPYASFVTFDAPSRETCTVRRPRTNTPLQALVLMNDPVYVESARAFGLRILKQGGKTVEERVRFAVRTALSREPSSKELSTLKSAFEREFKNYTADRAAANQLIHVGASRPPSDVDPSALAAWTVVGSILLNLDEVITKG